MSYAWPVKPLSEVIGLRRGFDLPNALRVDGPFPILSAGAQIGTHEEAKVKGPGFAVGRATNLGVPQWSDTDFWPLNTTLYAEDFKGNDPRWLYRLFQTLDLSGFDSGSVQPMLNRNYIAQVPVAVPPVDVQVAIAEVLGALDDKNAANRQVVEASRTLAVAVVSRLNACCPVSDVADQSRSSIDPPAISEPVVLHYSLPAFDDGAPESVAPTSLMSAKNHLREPVVLVAKLNPRIPRIWAVPRVQEMPALASPEFVALAPRDASVGALWAALAHPAFTEELLSFVAGTTGSHQRVKPEYLLSVSIPDVRQLTPEDGGAVDSLVDLIEQKVIENQALAKTRDELLPLLMSGRITVKDAEKRVEGVV